jgi:hypothetical protein
MTATLKKPKNFEEALQLNLDWVNKKVAIVLAHSFVSLSQKTILYEIEMVRCLRPNLNKFFYNEGGTTLENKLTLYFI